MKAKKQKLLLLSLVLFATGPLAAAASGDDIELDAEAFDAPAGDAKGGSDNVSFDDFDKADSGKTGANSANPKVEAPPPDSGADDEMTLEPLQGNEDQVTDIQEKSTQPAPAPAPVEEATPKEMTPPPPSVAEPGEPTPAPSPQPMDDEPNLELEARLHDIYMRFNSKKLSNEEWSQLIGQRESEVYKIQRGDTLWSISKTFFNDGNYWPKIWQLNSGITNPHLITPGNEIRFLLGTESETPAFAVTEQAEEQTTEEVELPAAENEAPSSGAPEEEKTQEAAHSPTDGVDIPPPGDARRPVLKHIPPSLPEWGLSKHEAVYDELGMDFVRRPILDIRDKKYLEGFVDEPMFKNDGELKEIEGGGETAGVNQYVFVSLPKGVGQKGDRFTVVRSGGQIEKHEVEVALDRREMPFQYKVQGEVRLEDELTTTNEIEPKQIFRGLIVRCIGQVERGSMLVKGTMPQISVETSGPKANIVTQIVGAQVISQEKTVPLYGLVFLSSGSKQGLEEGQILTVRANTRIRNAASVIEESYIPVGQIRVVRVGEKFSTGIIVRVWDAIFVGDVTGDGKVLPPRPLERISKQSQEPKPEVAKPEQEAEDFEKEMDSAPPADSKGGGSDAPMNDFDDLQSE